MMKAISRFFGYDAAATQNRRRMSSTSQAWSEDRVLNKSRRRNVVENSRDLSRNMSIAAWAVRKHLENVSTFDFQARNDDEALNRRIEELFAWWSRPYNCDTTGRFGFQQLVSLAEQRRTIDGDVFFLKNTDGRLQLIESDRVRTREEASYDNESNVVQGIELTRVGRHSRYAVHSRTGAGYKFDRWYPSARVEHLGYFDRYDQVRGISPLAPAINTFVDLYESFSYALAKAKLGQILGIAITRDAPEPVEDPPQYDIDFDSTGVKTMNLEPGDSAEIIESKTPATEFQSFTEQMIQAALKSLDIPMIVYDESRTNYSGARVGLIQYEQSAEAKRLSLKNTLDRLMAWRIGLWIDNGLIELPRGMTVSDLRWEWISRGVPWVDPLKEVNAEIQAINAGLVSRQEVSKRHGRDWHETIRQLEAEQRELAATGVNVALPSGMVPIDPMSPTDEPVGATNADT